MGHPHLGHPPCRWPRPSAWAVMRAAFGHRRLMAFGSRAIYGLLAVVYFFVDDLGPVKRDFGQRTWTPSLVSTSWVMSTSQAVEMRA
jgi:hypothetical protein